MDTAAKQLNTNNLLADYEDLLHLSKRMLSRSREGRWQELMEDEMLYVAAVARINELGGMNSCDRILIERKSSIIEQIMEMSVEIRSSLIKRRGEIGLFLKSSQQRATLDKAYGANDFYG